MKTYARIRNEVVTELFATDGNIGEMFCPELTWIDVSEVAGIAEGWTFDGTAFSPPQPAAAVAAPIPSLADLQTRMAALSAELQSLAASFPATAAP